MAPPALLKIHGWSRSSRPGYFSSIASANASNIAGFGRSRHAREQSCTMSGSNTKAMVTTLPARSTAGKRRKDVQDAAPGEGKAGWMATVRKVIRIDTDPATAWDAVRDWTALPTRLVRGFVVDTKADGEDRIVTFFNGIVARER